MSLGSFMFLLHYSLRHPWRIISIHVIGLIISVSIIIANILPVLQNNPYEESAWQRISYRLFDNSISNIIGSKSQEMSLLGDFQDSFGSDEFIQLILSGTGPVDSDVLNSVTDYIARIEIGYTGSQVHWIGRLPHAPDQLKLNKEVTDTDVIPFLERLRKDPVAGRLIRFDNSSWDLALIFKMPDENNNDASRARFARFITDTWNKEEASTRWHSEIIGVPILLSSLRSALENIITINVPLVNLIIFVICWLIARRLRLVLLIYLPLLQAEIWLFAAYFGSGNLFNYVTANMSTVVMVIGTAINIHILSAYVRERVKHGKSRALIHVFKHVAKPIIFATITTTIALLSFYVSKDPAIRDFGLFSSIGILLVLLFSFTLLPAAIILFDTEKKIARKPGQLIPLILRLPFFAWNRPRFVLVITSLIILVGLAGTSFLRIGTNVHGYFMPDSELRQAMEYTSSRFPGYIPFEAIVEWPDDGQTDGRSIINLSKEIESAIVRNVLAEGRHLRPGEILNVADLTASYCLNPKKKSLCPNGLPSTAVANVLINSLKVAIGENYFDRNRTHSQLRLTIFFNPVYSSAAVSLISDLRKTLEEVTGPKSKAYVTGMSTLWALHDIAITKSLILSLIIASAIILLLMAAIYRGWRPFLISLLPNAAPMVVVLGVTGFFCTLLNAQLPSTAFMFTTVAAGIIVDATLFFVLTYQRCIKHNQTGETALRTTLSTVGPGIILTGLTLSLGTATLLMGELVPIKVFGGLLSLTIAVALLADLLILPALCRLYWNPGYENRIS